MIKSFKCSKTKALFLRKKIAKQWQSFAEKALLKLYQIEMAELLSDLIRPPSNRLEKLKGDRKGQYSIRINKQWRICFKFEGSHAYDVEIIDYH